MKKLWQKNWKLNSFVESFETKDDLLLDNKLTYYDVLGSLAQAKMLFKIGILTKKEQHNAIRGLQKIEDLSKLGKFNLQPGDEDIHTKIENFLTEQYGEVGKKIHTGRSRNDQVLTALRLYTKDNMFSIWENVFLLVESFVSFAKKYKDVPMPGYTHMQKAMPYTWGTWAESFMSAFSDDIELLKSSFHLINQSPLGSAAAFGTPLSLDRQYTAKLLGFEKVQDNTLYCQNSRGKFEAVLLSTLVSILSDLNRFASDVLLFTTSEFGLLNVDPTICTGSSIMPQKKNVDLAELIRSKVHIVLGYYTHLVSIPLSLISGYNRDLQDTKKPLFESLEVANSTIQAAKILVKSISPNKDAVKKAMTHELYATHKAFELTQKGISFREAYNTAGRDLMSLENEENPTVVIPSDMKNLKVKMNEQKKIYQEYKKVHDKAVKNLLEKGGE